MQQDIAMNISRTLLPRERIYVFVLFPDQAAIIAVKSTNGLIS